MKKIHQTYSKTSVKPLTLFLLFFLMSIQMVNAQKNEIGLGAGTTFYTGDLQPEIRLKFASPMGQVFYRRNINSAWSLRANAAFGQIREGDIPAFDNLAEKRKMAFSSQLYELAALVEYNFMDYKAGKGFLPFTPFLFGGVAFIGHTSTSFQLDVNTIASTTATTESDYSGTNLSIPFGTGLKYSLSNRFELNFEFGARYVLNDKLDNVEGAPEEPIMDPQQAFKYGNSNDNDWYYFTTLSISYTFYSVPCAYNFY